MIATAESCTGGLITAALTEIAGSSDVVDRGYVTYTNAAKSEMLGVDADMIMQHGAVSPEVAQSMAIGALDASNAQITIAVTGVAGPGQSESKPSGLVYFGCVNINHHCIIEKMNFTGDRHMVRQKTVLHALDLAARMAESMSSISGK